MPSIGWNSLQWPTLALGRHGESGEPLDAKLHNQTLQLDTLADSHRLRGIWMGSRPCPTPVPQCGTGAANMPPLRGFRLGLLCKLLTLCQRTERLSRSPRRSWQALGILSEERVKREGSNYLNLNTYDLSSNLAERLTHSRPLARSLRNLCSDGAEHIPFAGSQPAQV